MIRRRCFVMGCPRSGTTLVQAMLAVHPEVISFPETKYVSEVVGDYPCRVLGHRRQPSLRSLRTRIRLALGIATNAAEPSLQRVLRELGRPELARPLGRRPIRIERAVRALVGNLDTIATEAGCPVWVEKTPTHYAYVDQIEPFCDAARFVHVVRPGADVVASLTDAVRRHPGSFWSRDFGRIDQCIRVWNQSIRATASRVGQANHYVLDFRRLTTEPEAELRVLCRWLGLEFMPGMVTDYGSQAESIVLSREHWKSGIRREIGPEDKFHSLFTAAEQTDILNRLVTVEGLFDTADRQGI